MPGKTQRNVCSCRTLRISKIKRSHIRFSVQMWSPWDEGGQSWRSIWAYKFKMSLGNKASPRNNTEEHRTKEQERKWWGSNIILLSLCTSRCSFCVHVICKFRLWSCLVLFYSLIHRPSEENSQDDIPSHILKPVYISVVSLLVFMYFISKKVHSVVAAIQPEQFPKPIVPWAWPKTGWQQIPWWVWDAGEGTQLLDT